jgi:hypothetical protein
MSLSETSESRACGRCGHPLEAVCDVCGREFGCGSLSVLCPDPSCDERVLDPDGTMVPNTKRASGATNALAPTPGGKS